MAYKVNVGGVEVSCDTPEEAISLAAKAFVPPPVEETVRVGRVDAPKRSATIYEKTCQNCGKPFTSALDSRRFCGNRCYRIHSENVRLGLTSKLPEPADVCRFVEEAKEATRNEIAEHFKVSVKAISDLLLQLRREGKLRLTRRGNTTRYAADGFASRTADELEVADEEPIARDEPEEDDVDGSGTEDSRGAAKCEDTRTETERPQVDAGPPPPVRARRVTPEGVEYEVVWSGGGPILNQEDRLGSLGSSLNPHASPSPVGSRRRK